MTFHLFIPSLCDNNDSQKMRMRNERRTKDDFSFLHLLVFCRVVFCTYKRRWGKIIGGIALPQLFWVYSVIYYESIDFQERNKNEWFFLLCFKEVTTKGSEDDVDLVKWFRVIVMQTEHIVMGVFNCYFLIYDSINNRNYIDARLISKIECVRFNIKKQQICYFEGGWVWSNKHFFANFKCQG